MRRRRDRLRLALALHSLTPIRRRCQEARLAWYLHQAWLHPAALRCAAARVSNDSATSHFWIFFQVFPLFSTLGIVGPQFPPHSPPGPTVVAFCPPGTHTHTHIKIETKKKKPKKKLKEKRKKKKKEETPPERPPSDQPNQLTLCAPQSASATHWDRMARGSASPGREARPKKTKTPPLPWTSIAE